MNIIATFARKSLEGVAALVPFSIALAMLVFASIPGAALAATTYYVDIPNLGAYGSGYSVNGTSYAANYQNPNNYPNFAYQYYKNPNLIDSSSTYQNGYGSSYGQVKANYVPYAYPTYVQYVRQADGTYKLGTPKTPPAYAWNADNSLPSSSPASFVGSNYGSAGYAGYGAGRGFTLTSER